MENAQTGGKVSKNCEKNTHATVFVPHHYLCCTQQSLKTVARQNNRKKCTEEWHAHAHTLTHTHTHARVHTQSAQLNVNTLSADSISKHPSFGIQEGQSCT